MSSIGFDVAIIGGGLVGCMTAYALRKRGRSVVVLERGHVGGESSGVSFGSLRLQGQHDAELPLALRAQDIWESIEAELGESVEFVRHGHVHLALNAEHHARLENNARQCRAQPRRAQQWFNPDLSKGHRQTHQQRQLRHCIPITRGDGRDNRWTSLQVHKGKFFESMFSNAYRLTRYRRANCPRPSVALQIDNKIIRLVRHLLWHRPYIRNARIISPYIRESFGHSYINLSVGIGGA